jgi:hypothetical protein
MKRHDNVQGDLNTAIGEANLLLGKLSGHQKYIGFAFGNFHFTASFGQVYLRNRKREKKSTDILSKALNTIHST